MQGRWTVQTTRYVGQDGRGRTRTERTNLGLGTPSGGIPDRSRRVRRPHALRDVASLRALHHGLRTALQAEPELRAVAETGRGAPRCRR